MTTGKTNAVQTSIAKLMATGLAAPNGLRGCSDAELDQLSQKLGAPLPEAYRQFLQVMGKSAGRFMQGSDFLYPVIADLQTRARKLLADDGVAPFLTSSDIVFLMHQGYEFLFMRPASAKDPSVWAFGEGDEKPAQVYEHFSAWLAQAAQDEASLLRSLKK